MQYSSHTNYQTSFRVERTNEEQTFFDLLRVLYDWLKTKEKEKTLKGGWKDFIHKAQWKNCYGTHANIITETCIEGDGKRAWVLEYVHPDKELGYERYWHTNVGIRDLGNELVVSVRIAYSWNQESLSRHTNIPQPSVPYFVRQLISRFNVFSGGKSIRLLNEPVSVSSETEVSMLSHIIFLAERKYPVIVFNGSSDPMIREAQYLATQLAGKVQVLVIQSNPEMAKALKDHLDKDYHVHYNFMRVFYPLAGNRDRFQRHRFFDVQSQEYTEQREGIVHGLLCNHNIQEHKSVLTIADIKRLISRQRILKMREENTKSSPDELKTQIDELYKYIEDVEKERDVAKDEAEDYAQQVDRREADLKTLEWKLKSLEKSHPNKGVDLKAELFTLPADLYDVVTLASKIHADTLIFADEAFTSAKASKSEYRDEAWEILSYMAKTLYDLKFNTESSGDIGKKFSETTGYEYSKTEGPKTKKDRKLSRLRKITHDGKDYEIWPHIGKGNDTSGKKCVRIHFAYDNEKRKILIGYVGSHMDNAST